MSYFIEICPLCLNREKDCNLVQSKDTNIKNKLEYCLPENDFTSGIAEYICVKCENELKKFYELKRKWLQNMAVYKKYAQQITTKDESYKFLSVELVDDNNYNTSYSELPTESNVKAEQQQQITKDSDEENNYTELQTKTDMETVNNEEFIIKKESDELVLDDELAPLLREIMKQESNNENIIEDNVLFLSENGKNIEINETEKIHTDKLFTAENCNKLLHTCEVCNKSFSQSSLKQHKLIHTREKPFTCEVCNKSFRLLETLNRHKLIHTGGKLYICEVCNISFGRSYQLKVHKVEHIGKNPFACEVCDKSFKELHHLKRHQLVHNGEKPFTCEVCNKSFKQSVTLKHHTHWWQNI